MIDCHAADLCGRCELQGLQTKDRHSNSEWVVRCNALEEKIQELEQEKRESVEALENRIKASASPAPRLCDPGRGLSNASRAGRSVRGRPPS